MPSFLLENSVTGPGIRADMGAENFATTIVALNSYQLSTDSIAIVGTGQQQRVTVQGYVASVGTAIGLTEAASIVSITATGIVAGLMSDLEAAVRMSGGQSRIINAGEISGGVGVALIESGDILNSGTITGMGTA